MQKPIYIVEHRGIEDYSSTSLTACLRHIGKGVLGTQSFFGCLTPTTKQAVEAGYSIKQV